MVGDHVLKRLAWRDERGWLESVDGQVREDGGGGGGVGEWSEGVE